MNLFFSKNTLLVGLSTVSYQGIRLYCMRAIVVRLSLPSYSRRKRLLVTSAMLWDQLSVQV